MRLGRTHGSAQVVWNVPLPMEISQEDAQHPAAIPDACLAQPGTRIGDEPAQYDRRQCGRLNQIQPSEIRAKAFEVEPVVVNRRVT
jgi:hypothetical protein